MQTDDLWANVRDIWTTDNTDPEPMRKLLVLLWIYLSKVNVSNQAQFQEFTLEELNERCTDFEQKLYHQIALPEQEPSFGDFCAVAAALDHALAGLFFSATQRWIGYSVDCVQVSTPAGAQEYWLSKRLRSLDDNLPSVAQRELPYAVFFHHRVTPKITSKNFAINVSLFPAEHRKRLFSGNELQFAAMVFDDDVELDIEVSHERFAVLGFKQGGANVRLSAALNLINKAVACPRVLGLMLPEMCVSKELERSLVEGLRKILQDQEDERAVLFLPGSFHEKVDGKRINTATLYLVSKDFAQPVLRHQKFARAFIGKVMEDIEVATSIELVATPAGVWAIAICMDFCSDLGSARHLWNHLAVDVVFVPSHGNETTLKLHKDRASYLFRREHVQVVIAQQMHPAHPNWGVVLPMTPGSSREPVLPDDGMLKTTISF